jgi:hypothetical protein
MGDLEAALEARNDALSLAEHAGIRRYIWEGHHFRWRLHFWLGNWEAALDDLTTLSGFDPTSMFYAYVYPALVHAAAGDTNIAVSHAWRLAESGDGRPDDEALRVLWAAACLRLVGVGTEAAELLDGFVPTDAYDEGSIEGTGLWTDALLDLSAGELAFDDLLALTNVVDATERHRLVAAAHFHAGVLDLEAGDRVRAMRHFEEAHRCYDSQEGYTFHSRLLLTKLARDEDWPPWIPRATDRTASPRNGH